MRAKNAVDRPVHVLVCGGTYPLWEPFVLTPEDSGTPEHPVTWTAAPGETAILTGARPITGWREAGDGRWVASLPEVAEGRWHFKTLYVDGERRANPGSLGL